MVTMKAVNDALAKEFPEMQVTFERGDGYQWFDVKNPESPDIPSLEGYCYLRMIPNVQYIIDYVKGALKWYEEHGDYLNFIG